MAPIQKAMRCSREAARHRYSDRARHARPSYSTKKRCAEMRQHCDRGVRVKRRDVVATQDAVAAAIVARYAPTGKMLDPCRGGGAFWKHMPGAAWCEISEGRDFFDWKKPVDWIVGNPPYSVLNRWLEHSFSIATNVVYLIPIAKVFGSRMRLQMVQQYGGIVDVWAPWTGRDVGFEFGWAVGAVHFRRGYKGRLALSLELGGTDPEKPPVQP